MKVLNQIILAIAFIGYISCQSINDLDINDAKKKLEETVPGFDQLDTSKFNTSNLPSEEDVEKALKEKCRSNGAENAVGSIKEQQEVVKVCVENQVNYTLVMEELEEAKKTGSMDEVFGKYCKKWPTIYACFDNVTETARSCMDDKEEKAFNKSLEILSELQEFMCFKDGDRLAMFVAEHGIECIQEQKAGLEYCFNTTLGTRIPDTSDFSVSTLPTFLFTAKDCEDFDAVRQCINKELEKCENTTPANIVDAFFKFLKKHMPCMPEARKSTASERSFSPASAAVSGALVFASILSLIMF